MKNFTPVEMAELEIKIRQYQSPWISRKIFGLWFKFIKYTILPTFLILCAVGIYYNSIGHWTPMTDVLWKIIKGILFYWFGYAILILIAFIVEYFSVRKERKRLNLTQEEWNYIVKYFNIERTW